METVVTMGMAEKQPAMYATVLTGSVPETKLTTIGVTLVANKEEPNDRC